MNTFVALLALASVFIGAVGLVYLAMLVHQKIRNDRLDAMLDEYPSGLGIIHPDVDYVFTEEDPLLSDYPHANDQIELLHSMAKTDPSIRGLETYSDFYKTKRIRPTRGATRNPLGVIPMPQGLDMTLAMGGHAAAGAELGESVNHTRVNEALERFKKEDEEARIADEDFYKRVVELAGPVVQKEILLGVKGEKEVLRDILILKTEPKAKKARKKPAKKSKKPAKKPVVKSRKKSAARK